jgi:hypothetical protein
MNKRSFLMIFIGMFIAAVIILAGYTIMNPVRDAEPNQQEPPTDTVYDENTLTPEAIEIDPLDEFPPGEPPNAAAGGGATMPREAAMACADLSVGDACTYDTPGGMIEGTCTEVDGGVGCM